jgi:hypothetical protein
MHIVYQPPAGILHSNTNCKCCTCACVGCQACNPSRFCVKERPVRSQQPSTHYSSILTPWSDRLTTVCLCACVCLRVHVFVCVCVRACDRAWRGGRQEFDLVQGVGPALFPFPFPFLASSSSSPSSSPSPSPFPSLPLPLPLPVPLPLSPLPVPCLQRRLQPAGGCSPCDLPAILACS